MRVGKQNGFTLVELLIVIFVVGILTGLVLLAYTNTQKRARDAKRADDINSIRSLMLSYEATQDALPRPAVYGEVNGGGYDTSPTGDWLPFLHTVMKGEIPKDPINDAAGDPTAAGGFAYFYQCYRHGYDAAAPDPNNDVMRLGYRQETTGELKIFDIDVNSCNGTP